MKKLIIIGLVFFTIGISYSKPDSIFVIISGDTVSIWNTGAYENCGCKFKMDVNISNDTIYITEIDTSKLWMRCKCNFDLSVNIVGLNPNHYYVEVYRTLNWYPGTFFYIGSTSFTIGGTVLTLNIFNPYQSPCYNINSNEEISTLPDKFELFQNYPNPYNPTTTIEFSVPHSTYVSLKIFNLLGEEIVTLINEKLDAGKHKTHLEGIKLPSGIYYYQLKADKYIDTKKLVLIK